MAKISLDRRGNLRQGLFYRFHVPFDDRTDGLPTTPDWLVVPRTPTDDALEAKGEETWIWVSPLADQDTRTETKDCPVDANHVTHAYYKAFSGEAFGGKRVSSLIPIDADCCIVLSEELRRRVNPLKLRGARVDSIDLKRHGISEKLKGYWALQFIGKARLRVPKVDAGPNMCPFCGRGALFCESCGHWPGVCQACKKAMAIIDYKHGGRDDKRIAFEKDIWTIIEGKDWDGSDLIQAHGRNFASKRFIDWLLRIHAAPFYAEPVWFCVDGMNDEQKRWFEELKKPLES